MFSKADALPGGRHPPADQDHPPESSPMVGNVNTLTPRVGPALASIAQAAQHARGARVLPDMSGIWPAVFAPARTRARCGTRTRTGGLVGNNDRCLLNDLRSLSGDQPAKARANFDDPRLAGAAVALPRNLPQTSPEEQELGGAPRCLPV